MTAMPPTQTAHPAVRARPDAGAGAGARSGGYVLAIVINALLLYVVHHLVAWEVWFITPGWNDVLWSVDLSLQATIVANVLFLVYDARWFHSLVQVGPAAESDLIVMSTQALTGPARALLGSVADAVVRRAHCPVLLVHRDEAMPVARPDGPGEPGRAAPESAATSA